MKYKTAIIITASLMTTALSAQGLSDRTFECEGNTHININGRVTQESPFQGVFQVAGDTITMTVGDTMRFSETYKASAEITNDKMYGFTANDKDKGDLVLYKDSGYFRIFNFVNNSTKSGISMKFEVTIGKCQKLVPSDVFL